MPGGNEVAYKTLGLQFEGALRVVYKAVTGGGNFDSFVDVLVTIWQVYSIIAFLLSALFLFGLIYAKIRYAHYAEIEQQLLRDAEAAYAHEYSQSSENRRWRDALAHIESENPNDWRLAIIEADIMLEELLDTLGYPGTTIGDKLKQASPQTFKTVDDAWKAHKVRNDIAHRGTDFVLTKRLARETLEHYQRVFQEFSLI